MTGRASEAARPIKERARSIECPRCCARPGASCTNVSNTFRCGRAMVQFHAERWDAARSDATAELGAWLPYGRPKAICRDDHCPWKYVHNSVADVTARASAHALATGHEVDLDRTLTRVVRRAA